MFFVFLFFQPKVVSREVCSAEAAVDDFVLPNVKWSSTFFPPDSA